VLDPLRTFATDLRRLREKRGLSQERLGEEANIHMTHVSKIERSQCEPGVRTVYKLAGALQVSVAALFEGITEGERIPLDRPEGAGAVRNAPRARTQCNDCGGR
jgi:transcriptional regulator with XRE-family HTH domain